MTRGGPRQQQRRALHDCPECGVGHYCHTDECAVCRETVDVGYHGGWFVQGGVRRPLYPERRSA